jgi:hypothetical protein
VGVFSIGLEHEGIGMNKTETGVPAFSNASIKKKNEIHVWVEGGMTQNDIIRMAKQAGIIYTPNTVTMLERFAQLVITADREACAKIADIYVDGCICDDAKLIAEDIRSGRQA